MRSFAGSICRGRTIGSVLRAILFVVLALALSASARAESQSININYDQAVGLAAKWILEKQFGPARQMLAALEQAHPGDPQVLFLEGQLAFAEGDYKKAVAIYRRMLTKNPGLIRVRLELARALFAARDYEAAQYHFEIALGQTLNEQVRENIYAFLRAIRGRTSWFRFSAVFGPDSNPNFATSSRTVDILGTTFVLNPDARAKRSFGADITGQGRYAFGEENRNFLSGNVEYRDYAGSYADWGALELTAGRSLVTGETLWTGEFGPLLANYQQKELYHGAIARVTQAVPLGERVLSSSYVSVKRLNYRDYTYLTGNQYWAGTTLRYALDPTSSVWTSVSLGRSLAHDAAFSYQTIGGVLGYSKELPAHFNVQAQVSTYRYNYDQPQPLFGAERRDDFVQVDVGITARDWSFQGIAPTLMLSAGRNQSSIPLYTYERRFVGV
ncbi:MAG TPA: surface lipoprotein assembly modifier, partial [Burkholderiales bacterium]|nr:surface lipoprotein assembly modifier [Burkholderiales bacterium]